MGVYVRMVPGARIELATPAFSGRRSTNELPRQLNFSSLVFTLSAVKFARNYFQFPLVYGRLEENPMTTTELKSSGIIPQLDALAKSAASGEALMKSIVALLHEQLTRYNWVGFYMLEREGGDTLVLGPFKGTMTPHTRIPLNQGICGAAASSGKTIVVDDVNSDSRYLACSLETKSEIVVPVFVRGKVVGELDIDSHFLAAFGPDDRKLCEHAAAVLGKFLESHI